MKTARKKKDRLDAEDQKLLALAKAHDQKHGMRRRGTKGRLPRVKPITRTEAELIALGGVKNGCQIVFGGDGDAQLTFTPFKGGWKVGFEGKLSLEELRRELCKAGRGLWDSAEQRPDIAFQAVESLLSCWHHFRGLPSDEQQKVEVHFAISRTLQALERDAKTRNRRTLQVAFKLLTDNQLPQLVDQLQERAWWLASELERPPSKQELLKSFGKHVRKMGKSQFSELLKDAGLSWLRHGNLRRGIF